MNCCFRLLNLVLKNKQQNTCCTVTGSFWHCRAIHSFSERNHPPNILAHLQGAQGSASEYIPASFFGYFVDTERPRYHLPKGPHGSLLRPQPLRLALTSSVRFHIFNMPAVVESELSFDTRMQLREKILGWISRDLGLSEFLIPAALTSAWSEDQKEAWTHSVIEKYMQADDDEDGLFVRRRVLACETAGSLRRSCIQLRQRTASHRDVIKTSVALEALWNATSSYLGDDRKWAKCSLMFDTALISLRVVYLWMYLKEEASSPQATLETRKSLFEEAVKGFFTMEAPTDDAKDKHSDNFKKLLEVWRQELDEYQNGDQFETLISGLEKTQSLDEAASCVEKFLATVNVDKSWVLSMQKIETEIEEGLWTRKGKGRGKGRPSKSNGKSSKKRTVDANGDYDEPPTPDSESSFEPAAADSDFDIKDAVDADDEEQEQEENDSEAREDLPAAVRSRRVIGVYEGRTRQATMGNSPIARRHVTGGDAMRSAADFREQRLASLRAQKRIHGDTLDEDTPQTPERSIPHSSTRNRRSHRPVRAPRIADEEDEVSLEDLPRMKRSTERRRAVKPSEFLHTERPVRTLRSREGNQEERTRQRALRRTHAEMTEVETHNNGPVEYSQPSSASRESRRRRLQAALEADAIQYGERMTTSPEVRKSPRRTRK